MSRSYKKIVKLGNCGGSNTEYYRTMNRKCRAKNRHTLRSIMANYDIETVSDNIPNAEIPIRDSWNEPTDGTYIVSKEDKNFYINDPYFGRKSSGTSENFWNRKFGKYLKSKH